MPVKRVERRWGRLGDREEALQNRGWGGGVEGWNLTKQNSWERVSIYSAVTLLLLVFLLLISCYDSSLP